MKDVPHNELLSAYLDGELTAAEQVEMERLLAASPAARQLLDELRALSSTLQALPQHKLGEDIGPQVIRIAERRMLSSPAPARLPKPVPLSPTAILRRVFNSRALVWSSLAVAVAVMLWVMDPGQQDRPAGDGIAMAPEEDGGGRGEDPSVSDRGAPAGGERGGEAPFDQPDAGSNAVARGELSDSVAADTPMPEEADEPPSLEPSTMNGAVSGRKAPGGPPKAAAEPPPLGKTGGLGSKRSSGGLAGRGRGTDDLAKFINAGQVDLPEGFSPLEAGYTVVCCDVSPKAFREQTIDHLLADNGIALEETLSENGVQSRTHEVADARAPRQDGGQREEQEQTVPGQALAYLSQSGELDLVCVAAPPAQVKATLAALKAQQVEFLSVLVEPAPGVEEQKDWGRQYGRSLERNSRRGGQSRAAQPGDATAAGAYYVPGPGAQAGSNVKAEGKPQLGRAVRLKVLEPALRGRPNARMRSFGYTQSGAAVQQPQPSTSPSAPEGSDPSKPAEPAMAPAVPAKRPQKSSPRNEQPESSPAQGKPPGKSQSLSGELDGASKAVSVGQAGKPPAVRSVTVGAGTTTGAPDEKKEKVEPRSEQEPPRQQPKPGLPERPVATYRVLFVLRMRMAGPDVSRAPPAAASMEQAKPAETKK